MKPHIRLVRPWHIMTGVAVLIALHLLVAHFALSHVYVPVSLGAGIVVLILLNHLGVLSLILARRRRK